MSGRHERFLRATMPAADLVFNLARRLTPTAADAEDLVQETYARAWAAWLPDDQQIAIILTDLCGFTAAEVSTITQTPRGTVLARVHRGRKKLTRAVSEVKPRAPRS